MKTKGLILIFTLIAISSSAQSVFFTSVNTLHVKEGETMVIQPSNKFIITKKWIMEDNSIVKFHPDVHSFFVVADEVEWGTNVLIDGRGRKGKNGKNGIHATTRDRAGDCAHGHNGTNASSGTKGSNGVHMKFTIGISKLGDVRILTNGGRGGNGGNGGNGMSGTKADCSSTCTGGNGGSGGWAGRGGDGGDGGNVLIEFTFLNTGMDMGRIVTEVKNGHGGKGGVKGIGGNAGAGKSCPLHKFRGGSRGADGSSPGDGTHGQEGTYQTIRID